MVHKNVYIMIAMAITTAAHASDHRLLCAASMGNYEDIIRLMAQGVPVGFQNENGETALHCAIPNGNSICAETLLLKTPEEQVNKQDRYGHTPLHLAAYAKAGLTTVRLLLAIQATHPNIQDKHGNTPLHIAANLAHKAVVRELIHDSRVDCTVKNNKGKTPKDLIIKNIKHFYPADYGKLLQLKADLLSMSFKKLLNFIHTAPDNQWNPAKSRFVTQPAINEDYQRYANGEDPLPNTVSSNSENKIEQDHSQRPPAINEGYRRYANGEDPI